MRKLLLSGLVALFATTASQAQAAWYQAKSKHFIIYSDDRPANLLAFATKLERFDRAVRFVRLMDDPAVGDGNRLTVFEMPNDASVRKLIGDKTGFIYGYYIGRASGPVAFVPRKTDAMGDEDLHADTVFFHEYSHHLMLQALDKAYPRWLVEGFAEFLSTARFQADGSVVLGAPAMHRAWGLYDKDRGLKLETILADNYAKLNAEQEESLYSRGWLLTHMLTFKPERSGQLANYVEAVSRGVAPLAAAQSAFGDLGKLDRELDGYLNRAKLTSLVVQTAQQAIPVEVTPLSEGAGKVIVLRAQSRSGVNSKNAETVAGQVRQVEQQYPGDALVETELAEAELDAGHAQAAETAADKALKADPRNTDAMVLKGRAVMSRAASASGNNRQGFENARRIFIAANKVDTEDPEPLKEYYESFAEEGASPTPNAVAALHYASNLAPQDEGLRLTSALHYLAEGKASEARRALAPVAFDPHGEELAQVARQVIAKIDAGDVKGALAAGQSGAR